MDELIAFRTLGREIGSVLIGEGQRRDPLEEQRRLRRLCELSVTLYERGAIQKKEFSWASMIARKFFLLPPYNPQPEEDFVVEYLAV